jgi:hypothetical protein
MHPQRHGMRARVRHPIAWSRQAILELFLDPGRLVQRPFRGASQPAQSKVGPKRIINEKSVTPICLQGPEYNAYCGTGFFLASIGPK